MAVIGGRQVGNNELGVIGAGVLVFIFSFLPFFSTGAYDTFTWNAWNTGFFSGFPVTLSLVAAALVAVWVFAVASLPPAGSTLPVLALSAVAALFLLIKLAIGFHSLDRQYGLFLALVAAIAQVAFAFLAFRVSGDTIPGQQRRAI